ncbi:dihydroorotate dehydrogenase-like protein [Candidatus Zixiibacteriota bacterium]
MDLKTSYMGLELSNPLVPGASPLTADVESCKQLEDAGAAALVLPSLFQEQIMHESEELSRRMSEGSDSFPEALTYFPDFDDGFIGPESYLEHIRKVKEAVDIPVIASLNGITTGGWVDYSQLMVQAGADALELNIYFLATETDMTSGAIEMLYSSILQETKLAIKKPVAVKIAPYFSALANMVKRLDDDGADAVVLFNRFYQPDIDLENLEVVPDLVMSTPYANRTSLRWIAILYGHLTASLGAAQGIHSHEDVLKMVMAGADITQITACLLQNGSSYLGTILENMTKWMEEKEYESLEQLKGSLSQKSVADPAAFERANYMKTLYSW